MLIGYVNIYLRYCTIGAGKWKKKNNQYRYNNQEKSFIVGYKYEICYDIWTQGVGKMTIGQELEKITELKLFT
jgi:hypothetical protein